MSQKKSKKSPVRRLSKAAAHASGLANKLIGLTADALKTGYIRTATQWSSVKGCTEKDAYMAVNLFCQQAALKKLTFLKASVVDGIIEVLLEPACQLIPTPNPLSDDKVRAAADEVQELYRLARARGFRTAVLNLQAHGESAGAAVMTELSRRLAKRSEFSVSSKSGVVYLVSSATVKDADQKAFEFRRLKLTGEPVAYGSDPGFRHGMQDVARQDRAVKEKARKREILDNILADTVSDYLGKHDPASDRAKLTLRLFTALTATPENEVEAILDLVDAGVSTNIARSVSETSRLMSTVTKRLQNQ